MIYGKSPICIAILDTGVALVQDLCLPHNRIAAAVDFVNRRSGNGYDDNAHGTHVPCHHLNTLDKCRQTVVFVNGHAA